ncbi:hypothetical protein LJC14_01500 [Treponema sp. OttesenSCG-928-L16]|nr:hypothetical protein [Treponema sp. OttesenSCG-928-L16]
MPWRLIGFILLFGIFLAFIGFNLQNASDVSLGFTVLQNVPVYLTAFSAFVLGMLAAIPFIASARRKNEKRSNAKKAVTDAPKLDSPELIGTPKKASKKWGKSKEKAVPGEDPVTLTEINSPRKDGGPYGID